jgi:hypothetical protein
VPKKSERMGEPEDLMTFTDLFINALVTGLGTGIGSYIATKYAIKHIEVVEEKIKNRGANNG